MSQIKNTLLCWHAVNVGESVLINALENLKKQHDIIIDEIVYLFQAGLSVELTKDFGREIRLCEVIVKIDNPSDHNTIYNILPEIIAREIKHNCNLYINISPGTPAMHAVWLILYAAGKLPPAAQLWYSQPVGHNRDKYRIDKVNFDITTYLSEINKVTQAQPELAHYDFEPKSPKRKKAFEKLLRYGKVKDAPILVLGEKGIGKTRLIETQLAAIKQCKNTITVACGSLDSTVADSLLFGHVKGAFTGASSPRKGLIEEAENGILFLDEVQDLPHFVQRKLVHVLQDANRRYRKMGADNEQQANFELVCASNLSLAELQHKLDDDFFDRISHLTVELPPLRECRADLITDWQRVWAELNSNRHDKNNAPMCKSLEQLIESHELSGNLRDLQSIALMSLSWIESGTPAIIALENGINEWLENSQHKRPKTSVDFGNGSYQNRVDWFKAKLALWARERWGSDIKAAKALETTDKTLRNAINRISKV